MTCRIFSFMVLFLLSISVYPEDKASSSPLDFKSLPAGKDGTKIFPMPFIAVAKTPAVIPPIAGGITIQTDSGFVAGFSGFFDEATGQSGFPGFGGHCPLHFSFDSEKIVVGVNFPYPFGRKTRADVKDVSGDLSKDDSFELLIDPRDSKGVSKGKIFRIIGNAAGIFKADCDIPQIGQFHWNWTNTVTYKTMMWDPSHSWVGTIHIPFKDLECAPADGDTWGVQCALRYADPKITAILSPTDNFNDAKRFARLRFDMDRRANFLCHWLTEELKMREFVLGKLFTNGGNEIIPIEVKIRLFKENELIGEGGFSHEAKPICNYDAKYDGFRIPSKPSKAEEKNTYAHILVTDKKFNKVIYEQFIPYWRPADNERQWLTDYFSKQFQFDIGVYPSTGEIEYSIDCATMKEVIKDISVVAMTVSEDGKEIRKMEVEIPMDGRIKGFASAGKMKDKAKYDVTAVIINGKKEEISRKTESFTRKVMPFETAEKPGLSDIVVPPFTEPNVEKAGLFGSTASVSCWARTYHHGKSGLFEQLTAGKKDILAEPARFFIGTDTAVAVPMQGSKPSLSKKGKGSAGFEQAFTSPGVTLKIKGDFSYDGFYHFTAEMSPVKDTVTIKDLHLEVPVKSEFSNLIEAPIEWMWKDWEKCTGLLEKADGIIWDSKRFPYGVRIRKSNMPPYVWFGDDERGISFSCATDEGMSNDDGLPAVQLERKDGRVTLKVSFVNKALKLNKPRSFQFAFQMTPFKPMLDNFRLWRTGVGKSNPYKKNGINFHTGWGIGIGYPTYGRCLNLAKNKENLDKVRNEQGYNCISASASSCSECAGTPEYQQFWREWGSELGFDKMNLSPLPEWVVKYFKEFGDGVEANPYVMAEAGSNCSQTNADYRVWWLYEVVKNCGVASIYQDNPPYTYHFQPSSGYGYIREDGVKEATCATWNQRNFMKRVAHMMVENGAKNSPYVFPNACGYAQPGRAFCRVALYGESLESDKIPIEQMRAWFSKQWGIHTSWLYQEPTAGATMKYWRTLNSRLFLHDVTDSSRPGSGDTWARWVSALDVFWLDDPSIVWHPYYRNETVASALSKNTLVSTYTAKGRVLFLVSNQAGNSLMEKVAFKNLDKFDAGELKYFYDAETGEEIELENGALKLFIPPTDYRIVIGFSNPWKFAVKKMLGAEDLKPQSSINPKGTIDDAVLQLLDKPEYKAPENSHRIFSSLIEKNLSAIKSDPANFTYFDAKACESIDIGDPAIRKSVFLDKKGNTMLIAYYNPTDTDRLLKGAARSEFDKKTGRQGHVFVIDPISGASHWNVIDLPAKSGRLELIYPDHKDYWNLRKGAWGVGTMYGNMLEAAKARAAEMEK